MNELSKKLLGQVLCETGLITEGQLKEALRVQKNTGQQLGRLLVQLGYLKESDLLNTLEHYLGISQIKLPNSEIDPNVPRLIPRHLAERYLVLPIERVGSRLTLAMVEPMNVMAIEDVRLCTGLEITPVLAMESEIIAAIEQHYGPADTFSELLADVKTVPSSGDEDIPAVRLLELVQEAPVVRLVNWIIGQAVNRRASDLHVEPQEADIRVRYRTDGILFELLTLPKQHQAAVVSRLKIMANLDIAEKRLPQDGRLRHSIDGRVIDCRVSTLPTIFGEKVVLRILDKSLGLLKIGELSFLPNNFQRFLELINRPHGIILLTGPTGSGKTTTLYAILNHLSSTEKNIVTIEDPVEYTLPGINQAQVNQKAGFSFANGLRSILRQDPDVIMVGEIRDRETADLAVEAALTGHLVLSTLHANSAPGAVVRLLEMGIEPFLIASAMRGVVNQRLVRTICGECRERQEISSGIIEKYNLNADGTFYLGQGCPYCQGTGYRGRLAIQEVLVMNRDLQDLVIRKASEDQINQAAIAAGMTTLWEDGLCKAELGLTSLAEVIKTVRGMQST
ncbi:MAG: type II/IV secretion system protein [Firmicutes bacterium]|nr:type II/IV secretion system protein [Bacillota bacterium]